MQTVRRLFESYLGLEPNAPGEASRWRLQWQWPIPGDLPRELIVGLLLAVVALALLAVWRETSRLNSMRRAAVIGLRSVAIGLVLVLLCQMTLAVDRVGLPLAVLLIDTSASMTLPQGRQDSGEETRSEAAARLMTDQQSRWLRELGRRFRVKLYAFDGHPRMIGNSWDLDDPDAEENWDRLADEVSQLTASGGESRPGAVVEELLTELRGNRPSAIVVLTDGVATDEDGALSAASPLATKRRVPLFPIGFGETGALQDLNLYDATVDEVAFLGDPVQITARMRAFGLTGRTVTVTVANHTTGEVLAKGEVAAGSDARTTELELSFTPEAEGDIEIQLSASSGVAEADERNNSLLRLVHVRKQKIRVLLADRVPRFEFHYLKSLLEREPTVELQAVLQEADINYAAEDRTAIDRFPLRREEIFSYDVIIFGDLDPTLLGAEVPSLLAEFVRAKGRGFIGIVGAKYFPAAYVGTPLDPLLPVEPSTLRVPPVGEPQSVPHRILPTVAGMQSSSMLQLEVDATERSALWDSLPPIFWNAAAELRPGAVALANLEREDGVFSPVIAMQRVGAGRSLLHLTDETWRWRLRVGDLYFGRYWIQTIRLLGRGALLDRDQPLELTSDRRRYTVNDPITLRARVFDGTLMRSNTEPLRVILEDRAGGREEIALTPVSTFDDIYEANITPRPAGEYHAWIARPAIEGVPPSVNFTVDVPDQEFVQRSANWSDLERAARQTGGKFFAAADAKELPRSLPAGRAVPLESARSISLWDRPEWLVLLVLVLGAEWLARRRWHLS